MRTKYPDDKSLGKPYRSFEDVPSLHQVVVDHFRPKADYSKENVSQMELSVEKVCLRYLEKNNDKCAK